MKAAAALAIALLLAACARSTPTKTTSTTAAPRSTVAQDDRGFALLKNGQMHHHYGADVALDEATEAALDHQLELTRAVVARFPTLRDALAAGYLKSFPFSPGLGLHATRPIDGLNFDAVIDDDDILNPQTLIYDGLEPDAPIAGIMYTSTGDAEPDGFAGPNDHWHYHQNMCVRNGPDGLESPLGDGAGLTKAACEAVGGGFVDRSPWMVHVWTADGYDNPNGVFADLNPRLACSDGTYYRIPEAQWPVSVHNVCRSDPS
jgi:hypothetical protein